MKIDLDIDNYKANFLGGNARQYLFYTHFTFPGFANIAQAGLQGALAGGSFDPTSLLAGIPPQIGSAMDVMGLGMSGFGLLGPGPKNGTDKFGYYVKSTSLPSSTINETNSYWAGQEYKMAGTQRFDEWTVTFNVDQKADIIKKFWKWMQMIHDPETNNYGRPVSYMADQEIHLLGMNTGESICSYKLIGAWPKSIGQVALEYASNDFATVDVTFVYQYFIVKESEQGALSGFIDNIKRGAGSIINNLF